MYTEIGPFSIVDGPKLVINEYNYALDNHLLFVEQPIGVGFSTIIKDQAPKYATEAAIHFEQFLINFFKVYPSLANNDLYIVGESYAGHYIPSFASRIIENQAVNNLPLIQGVIIGDGWTDPERQLMGYDSYAYSIGLISNTRRNVYKNAQNSILQDIMNEQFITASGLFDFITGTDPQFNQSIPNVAGNVNVYNYRQYNYSGMDGPLATWLNSTEVKGNFSVFPNNYPWISCNNTMYYDFYDDISRSYKYNITYLLDHTRVLLYNGQNDIIVNTPSAENWIYSLGWTKSSQFLQSPKINWIVNKTVVGTVKQLYPLTFVYVKNAGHMVPTDQPVNTLDMMRRWINNDTNWS
jgi:carboxypeptidase C (cathepsin A)